MDVTTSTPVPGRGGPEPGVFLYHLVVLEWVVTALGLPVFTGSLVQVLPLVLAVTVAIAALSRRLLEEPVLRWAHRLRPRRTVSPSDESTTAAA